MAKEEDSAPDHPDPDAPTPLHGVPMAVIGRQTAGSNSGCVDIVRTGAPIGKWSPVSHHRSLSHVTAIIIAAAAAARRCLALVAVSFSVVYRLENCSVNCIYRPSLWSLSLSV